MAQALGSATIQAVAELRAMRNRNLQIRVAFIGFLLLCF
jgi:hypothetical protein